MFISCNSEIEISSEDYYNILLSELYTRHEEAKVYYHLSIQNIKMKEAGTWQVKEIMKHSKLKKLYFNSFKAKSGVLAN